MDDGDLLDTTQAGATKNAGFGGRDGPFAFVKNGVFLNECFGGTMSLSLCVFGNTPLWLKEEYSVLSIVYCICIISLICLQISYVCSMCLWLCRV